MTTRPPAGDARFFVRSGPFSLDEVAAAAGAVVPSDIGPRVFTGVAPLQIAGPSELSFLDNRKYIAALSASSAGAVIVHPDMARHVPGTCVPLVTKEPYLGWAQVASLFHPPPSTVAGIHSSAVIDPTATVDASAEIGPFVVIGAHVEIGADCRVGVGTVIGDGVVIGAGTRVGSQCTISHALVGKRCFIFPGVRIGQEGFGFATIMTQSGPTYRTIPQLGRVLIDDDVEIGANTTVDRGSGQDTLIGAGSRLDNLVQIGHNVQLGRACVIVSQVGISGSSILEDFVVVAGQAGLAGHVRVGRGARIGGQAGVMSDIPAGQEYLGSPAQPAKRFFRQMATLRKLVDERAAIQAERRNNPAPGASASGPAGEAGSD